MMESETDIVPHRENILAKGEIDEYINIAG